jgi:hypothetical protein
LNHKKAVGVMQIPPQVAAFDGCYSTIFLTVNEIFKRLSKLFLVFFAHQEQVKETGY